MSDQTQTEPRDPNVMTWRERQALEEKINSEIRAARAVAPTKTGGISAQLMEARRTEKEAAVAEIVNRADELELTRRAEGRFKDIAAARKEGQAAVQEFAPDADCITPNARHYWTDLVGFLNSDPVADARRAIEKWRSVSYDEISTAPWGVDAGKVRDLRADLSQALVPVTHQAYASEIRKCIAAVRENLAEVRERLAQGLEVSSADQSNSTPSCRIEAAGPRVETKHKIFG